VRPGRPSAAPRRSVARSAPWWSVASPPRTGRRFSGSWRKPFADLPRRTRRGATSSRCGPWTRTTRPPEGALRYAPALAAVGAGWGAERGGGL